MKCSPLAVVLFLILATILFLCAETQAKHVDGIKHVIALKVVHKKVKKYLPKLIKSIHVVPLPVPIHIAKQGPKGLVIMTPKLPHHLPPVSPCRYAQYWHPKDLPGSGCEHAVEGWR